MISCMCARTALNFFFCLVLLGVVLVCRKCRRAFLYFYGDLKVESGKGFIWDRLRYIWICQITLKCGNGGQASKLHEILVLLFMIVQARGVAVTLPLHFGRWRLCTSVGLARFCLSFSSCVGYLGLIQEGIWLLNVYLKLSVLLVGHGPCLRVQFEFSCVSIGN